MDRLKSFVVLAFLFLFLNAPSAQSRYYKKADSYSPETYNCVFTDAPIVIDGKPDKAWEKAEWSKSFIDIQGEQMPRPYFDTKMKMLWDSSYFYFLAYMEEEHIWATLKNRDDIMFNNNDFEIFIDPDGDTHQYFEFEMNAFNAIWDLVLIKPYRDLDGPVVLNGWNVLDLKTAVHIDGTINDASDKDKGWAVEIAFPWKAIGEFARRDVPREGSFYRVNFSRVQYGIDIVNGEYKKKKDPTTARVLGPDNWVWSPQSAVNMHMPEYWGFVHFTKNPLDTFKIPESDKVKWALRQLYYQQELYRSRNGSYMTEIPENLWPKVEAENYNFEPKFYNTPSLFEIIAPDIESEGHWHIRQDGKIWYSRR